MRGTGMSKVVAVDEAWNGAAGHLPGSTGSTGGEVQRQECIGVFSVHSGY